MDALDTLQAAFGANESPKDKRTVKHESLATMAAMPVVTGGYDYSSTDIEHQHKEGICTAISLTQNAAKALGIKFSADFQYLLQKKFYDFNWTEGSSILNALKVATKYGFLPVNEFTYITEADRNLPYADYIAKLQAIPDAEITRLINLCSDYKLSGYASVDISSAQSIGNAIIASKSGIICRFDVGAEWYTALDGTISWSPADINPLRPPKVVESGHAITMAKFDYTVNLDQKLANTWGASWNNEGIADIMWDKYKPTEAWIPYYGLTEVQTLELKSQLQQKIGLLKILIGLWAKIKSFKGR